MGGVVSSIGNAIGGAVSSVAEAVAPIAKVAIPATEAYFTGGATAAAGWRNQLNDTRTTVHPDRLRFT